MSDIKKYNVTVWYVEEPKDYACQVYAPNVAIAKAIAEATFKDSRRDNPEIKKINAEEISK